MPQEMAVCSIILCIYLEEARRRYPEAMFPDSAAYEALVAPFEGEEEVAEASVVWKMEREANPRPPLR